MVSIFRWKDDNWADMKPGTWYPAKKDWLGAIFCCPFCGAKSFLGVEVRPNSTHKVALDGRVSPSVICMNTGCKFHDYVKLEDWDTNPAKLVVLT